MKYVLYIDYLAHCKKSYEYLCMSAKTLEDAMAEAESILKGMKKDVYLMRVLRKNGKVETPDKGLRTETYNAVVCTRGYGWHLNNDNHCENEHIACKLWLTKNPSDPWFVRI